MSILRSRKQPPPRTLQSQFSQTEDAPTESDQEVVTPDASGNVSRPHSGIVVLEADKPMGERMKSFKTRTIWAVTMMTSFSAIVAAGHFYCSLLTISLMGAIFYEITKLKRNYEKEHKLPLFFVLRWYWFGITNFYFIRVFIPGPLHRLAAEYQLVGQVLKYHSLISYAMLCVGLVAFVLSLRRFTLRYQFQQLSWALVTLLICVIPLTSYVANIYNGLVWFLVPSVLVIANDIFAYIFGFFFGKTPLIKLSPKKTWEGFIGGTVSTVVIAIILCEIMERYSYFMCPQDRITLVPFRFNDEISCPEFIPPPATAGYIGASALKLHALVLATFASLVAPFGGFFASGFKRAFKIKDFGDSIPGHGGITDRFDCQMIMGMFTYIYFNTFVAGGGGLYANQGSGLLTFENIVQFTNTLNDVEKGRLLNLIVRGGGI